jgi:hypothetical protein
MTTGIERAATAGNFKGAGTIDSLMVTGAGPGGNNGGGRRKYTN